MLSWNEADGRRTGHHDDTTTMTAKIAAGVLYYY